MVLSVVVLALIRNNQFPQLVSQISLFTDFILCMCVYIYCC